MRTMAKEKNRIITFSGLLWDNPNGLIMAFGDEAIPCAYIRTATGEYDVIFNHRLWPLDVVVSQGQSMGFMCPALVHTKGFGWFHVISAKMPDGAANNSNFYFTVTARDVRN